MRPRALALALVGAAGCADPTATTSATEIASSGGQASDDSTGAAPTTGAATDGTTGPGTSTGDADDTTQPGGSTGDTGEPLPACGDDGPGGALRWTLPAELLPEAVAAVASTPAGDAVIVGGSDLDEFDRDVAVRVFDAQGEPRWSDTYGGVHDLPDFAAAVAVDAEGFIHVLVRETVQMIFSEDIATADRRLVVLRYAPDGAHVWRWERPYVPQEQPSSHDTGGILRVVGETIRVLEAGWWSEPITLIGLDRFGVVVDEVPIAVPDTVQGYARTYALGPDGAVYVSGEHAGQGSEAAWIGRFDADGSLAWETVYGDEPERTEALIPGADGELYVVWDTDVSGVHEHFLSRYEVDGALAWTEPLPVEGADAAIPAGALHCSGSPVLAGGFQKPPGSDLEWDNRLDLWTARYAADGAPVWSHEHEFGPPYSYGSAHGIAATPGGDVLVIGSYLDRTGSSYAPWVGRLSGN